MERLGMGSRRWHDGRIWRVAGWRFLWGGRPDKIAMNPDDHPRSIFDRACLVLENSGRALLVRLGSG
jgi:hypothetical protein